MARFCYVVLETKQDSNGEYIPVIVKEDEPGYYETNWKWGKDLKVAEEVARRKNEALGLTDDDVDHIVLSSMKGKI